MKTVLLPIDFSENSRNAVDYAIDLFGDDECEFVLLNCYRTPHAGATMLVSIEDLMHNETINDLKEEKQRIIDNNPSAVLNIDVVAEFGDIIMGLNKVTRNRYVDVIVMGTKGASGVKEVIIGSNTAAVIKKVKRPIITVPENYKFTAPKHLVLAADYEETGSNDELKMLKAIATKYGSEISILNVHRELTIPNDDQVTNALEFNKIFEGIEHSFVDSVESDIAEGIENYINEHEVDILTLVSRERGFLETILRKSISKKMVMHAKCPTLVLHAS